MKYMLSFWISNRILDFNGAFYHIESIKWRNFVAMASRNILALGTQAIMIEKHKCATISSLNDLNEFFEI